MTAIVREGSTESVRMKIAGSRSCSVAWGPVSESCPSMRPGAHLRILNYMGESSSNGGMAFAPSFRSCRSPTKAIFSELLGVNNSPRQAILKQAHDDFMWTLINHSRNLSDQSNAPGTPGAIVSPQPPPKRRKGRKPRGDPGFAPSASIVEGTLSAPGPSTSAVSEIESSSRPNVLLGSGVVTRLDLENIDVMLMEGAAPRSRTLGPVPESAGNVNPANLANVPFRDDSSRFNTNPSQSMQTPSQGSYDVYQQQPPGTSGSQPPGSNPWATQPPASYHPQGSQYQSRRRSSNSTFLYIHHHSSLLFHYVDIMHTSPVEPS
jgi:hypothetical protein